MQLVTNRHVTDDQLERYALDRLDQTERDSIEEHLWMCEQCEEALIAEEAYANAMRTAAREVRQRVREPGWLFVPSPAWAWAAALLLVSLTTAVWRLSLRTGADLPATVLLEATRGFDNLGIGAPAGRAFTLTLDLSGLVFAEKYEVEIVNAAGSTVFRSIAASQGRQASVNVRHGLPSGMYYARLYSSTKELLREYGLQVGSR